MNLDATYVIYFMLLSGSVIFGFQTLLLGLGGRLFLLYRSDPRRTFKLASSLGLAIACLSILTAISFNLQPLYMCASVLAYMLPLSWVVSRCKMRLIKPAPPPMPPPIGDEEIKQILNKRGLDGLRNKEDKP
ncbi:MAG: hypothetical protein QMC89_02305 [Candidatus Hodarchaeaceae archaeon]|nr:hypothetical protein [Candidatus Hodarchaeaceae archaeon]